LPPTEHEIATIVRLLATIVRLLTAAEQLLPRPLNASVALQKQPTATKGWQN
jgi:hypothetical protein